MEAIKCTYQSDVGQIVEILLRHPRQAFTDAINLQNNWLKLNYTACPDYEMAVNQYDRFLKILEKEGVNVHLLPGAQVLTPDAIYVRDATILTDAGAILCRMGKPDRRAEPSSFAETYREMGIEILGRIETPGRLEGGDTFWLDPNTLVVGNGYRTNEAGISQLRALAGDYFDIIEVDLPHFRGPSDVFHLMSIISPLRADLALVYSPLMSVRFRQYLISRKIRLLELPAEEFESIGGNVLSLSPESCLMLKGNPLTKSKLETEGMRVIEYDGSEISVKGMGGPTCLTRPLQRRI